jgi:hypothetical protein
VFLETVHSLCFSKTIFSGFLYADNPQSVTEYLCIATLLSNIRQMAGPVKIDPLFEKEIILRLFSGGEILSCRKKRSRIMAQTTHQIIIGDSRNMAELPDHSVRLVVTHSSNLY